MSVPIQLGVVAALWAASLALLGYGLGRAVGEREGSEA